MFGRRRRPLLATAAVIGASRSAARHEVASQGQVAETQQQAAQMQAEMQMREEQERERRMQAAIDEAIAKERQLNEQTQVKESRAIANTWEVTAGQASPIYNSALADAKTVRYCRQCGNACRVGDKFCTHCGCMQEETGVGEGKQQKG